MKNPSLFFAAGELGRSSDAPHLYARKCVFSHIALAEQTNMRPVLGEWQGKSLLFLNRRRAPLVGA
jgi:hypothetical protein